MSTGQENINFKLQIGEVHNVTGYLRVDIRDNQAAKGEIASQCGVFPETGGVFLRVGNSATPEELESLFTGLTDDDSLQDLMENGEVQIFPSSTHKWYKMPVSKLFSGDIENDLLPILAISPNLSGAARLDIETCVTENDIREAVAANRSYLLALLKSFRIQGSTSLNSAQLQDAVQLIGTVAEFPLTGFMSLFRANIAAELHFESPDRVPKHLQKKLLDIENIGPEEDLKEFLTDFLAVAREPFEFYFFVTDLLTFKVSAHFPMAQNLKTLLEESQKDQD